MSDDLARYAQLAFDCIRRTYPNAIHHALRDDGDAAPPRQLHPAFHGCFDWHSAVHAHWTLARFARRAPDDALAAVACEALGGSLTEPKLSVELDYLDRPDRAGFELPYGLAWLLCLAAELSDWDAVVANDAGRHLAPLEGYCAAQLCGWYERLPYPIRAGEHSQSMFAVGLALDWARATARDDEAARLRARTEELHAGDRDLPLHLEPSGHDFLSPGLAAADLMRRVLAPAPFAAWLDRALPALGDGEALEPVGGSDRGGKLVHLDGLNLSRAWMLDGIAAALPDGDARRPRVAAMATAHGQAGLRSLASDSYAATHWLGTFAMYYATQRRPGPTAGSS